MPTARSLTFAPFRVRSFRFQWPADLLASWALEMETIILAWYVMVHTESVLWLTAFGSLQFLGTLAAPMFGVLGDRLGGRTMLCGMRAIYAGLAAVLMALALAGSLSPAWVLVVATCAEFSVLLMDRYAEERQRGFEREDAYGVAAEHTGRAFFTSA